MIKYKLKCHNNHEFTSWFSDSKEFEKLKDKNLLECIYCFSKRIEKSIMAPMISGSRSKNTEKQFFYQSSRDKKKELLKLRKYIENNFENVGDKFSDKVREIYYDKKTKKSIYGTVTPQEKNELIEEGIDLLSIPWVSKDN